MQTLKALRSRRAALAARPPRWLRLLLVTLAVAGPVAFFGIGAALSERGDAATASIKARLEGARAEFGQTCVPRWRVVAQGPKIPHLYDITALSATNVWAVGARGGSKRSMPQAVHWNGHFLQTVRPFMPSSGNGQLSDVAAVSRKDVWAVGIDGWGLGRPVIVHYDGRKWRVVATPALPAEASLDDVAAFAADDVWAVGTLGVGNGRPLLMRWNGRTWRVVDLTKIAPKDSDLRLIDGTSRTDVWAVGYKDLDTTLGYQTRLVLHRGGDAWAKRAVLRAAAYDDVLITAIDVVSPNSVWMVGNTNDESGRNVSSIVHWRRPGGGRVVYKRPENGYVGDIAAISRNNVWVTAGALPRPLLLHWDGRSWRIQRTGLDLNVRLHMLSAVSAKEIWAAAGGSVSADGKLGSGLLARYSC